MMFSLLLAFVVGIADTCPTNGVPKAPQAYFEAVKAANATPRLLPATTNEQEIAKLLDGLDLLVLCGGEDVAPELYGCARSPKLGVVNARRDAWEWALLDVATTRRLPLLGICRGCQVLNTYFGGTLWQDLPSEFPGNPQHRPVRVKHGLAVAPASYLAKIVGTNDTVNTRHHQAVKKLAPGFRIAAFSDDGVVEAIEGVGYPAYGLQFHPEMMFANDGNRKYLPFFNGAFIGAAQPAPEGLFVDLKTFKVTEGPIPSYIEACPAMLTLVKLPTKEPLYAGAFEVTQAQYEHVMGENPSYFTKEGASRPVEGVSYDRACEFLAALSSKTGIEFTLPTMEEWEIACRAGTTGDTYAPAPLSTLARYFENGGNTEDFSVGPEKGTAVAGSYYPNAWGLYDTLGNVREWVLGDPKCGTRKWTRGGAWALNAKKCSVKFEYFPDRCSDAPTSGFRVFSHGRKASFRNLWHHYVDPPEGYVFTNELTLVKKFDWPECDGELYLQRNGPSTFQRVLITIPKNAKGKVPAVVVPYYTPDGMIARDFETGEDQKGQLKVAFMRHCAERGWAAISGDSYHVTYDPENKIKDFRRWKIVTRKLLEDWPTWNGMAKRVFDTKLLTDLIEKDPRVNPDRLAIMGHSLGGQTSFYSGMSDPRFKCVVASDFGVRLDLTFWESLWYWGDKLKRARKLGFNHGELIRMGGGKPFCLIAGKTDDDTSGTYVRASGAYDAKPENFLFINHQKGHRPPPEALEEAYRFLANVLDR